MLLPNSGPGCPRPDYPVPGAQGWGPAQDCMDALHTEWGKAGPPHPAHGAHLIPALGPEASSLWLSCRLRAGEVSR